MNVEQIREYCLNKNHVTEDMPFDGNTLAFRVAGKMFLLTSLDAEYSSINLKCDPQRAVELREVYEEITAGYHMNKKHWNTVDCEGSLPASLITELIDHSYVLVVQGLPRKVRDSLQITD
ncbi:MAG: MmcQ/YjbR family DNA-binding protein [Saprospiraceae bacterium]|nr:MmcQ/YjbR family DNA-binding protein [Saprospiraceae bacterium]